MPDLWPGSLATRTTGQATAADAGPLVRVACDPDHWSGISRGCRTCGQGRLRRGPLVRHQPRAFGMGLGMGACLFRVGWVCGWELGSQGPGGARQSGLPMAAGSGWGVGWGGVGGSAGNCRILNYLLRKIRPIGKMNQSVVSRARPSDPAPYTSDPALRAAEDGPRTLDP